MTIYIYGSTKMGPKSISLFSGWMRAISITRNVTAMETKRLAFVIFGQNLPIENAARIIKDTSPQMQFRFSVTIRTLYTDKQRKGTAEEVYKFCEDHDWHMTAEYLTALERAFPVICASKQSGSINKDPRSTRILMQDLIHFINNGLIESAESLLPNILLALQDPSKKAEHRYIIGTLCDRTLLEKSKPTRDLMINLLNDSDHFPSTQDKMAFFSTLISSHCLEILIADMDQQTKTSTYEMVAQAVRRKESSGFSGRYWEEDKHTMIESYRTLCFPNTPRLPDENTIEYVMQHAEELPPSLIFYVLSLYSHNNYARYQEMLYPLAISFLKSTITTSPDSVIRSGVLNRQFELRAFVTAITIILKQHISLLKDLNLDEMQTRLLKSGEIITDHAGVADSSFKIGQNATLHNPSMKQILMTLAHEIGHNLIDQIFKESYSSPPVAFVHEFISDLFAFAFAQIMGWNDEIFPHFKSLLFISALNDPSIFKSPVAHEPHIIARCQMEIVIEWLKLQLGPDTNNFNWAEYLNKTLIAVKGKHLGFQLYEVAAFGKLVCDIIHPSVPGKYANIVFFDQTPYIPMEIWDQLGNKDSVANEIYY